MASLTSVTGEGCEHEKSSTAIDVIDDGGGRRKIPPGPFDDGEIELVSSGKSSPNTAAIDGISSEGSNGQVVCNYSRFRSQRRTPSDIFNIVGRAPESVGGQVIGAYRGFTPEIDLGNLLAGVEPHYVELTCRYLPLDLQHTSGTRGPFSSVHWNIGPFNPLARLDTRLPNGRAFIMGEEVEPGNRETGRLITSIRFGRGSAVLTPTSHDFRMEIMDYEPQAGNSPSILERRRRLYQAVIVLFVASELSATAFEIKYDESQMVAYFSMCTVCLISAMFTARLLAPLEGGTERFSVYLRGSSFIFLGLLRFLGVNQGSFVTALKIFLGMSQVVLFWWTSGLLRTYMNAFGMRHN